MQLHNALIISLFDATATLKRPPTPPPPSLPKPPPLKRRRTLLPYQGPDVSEDLRSIRSTRMKRWALSMGKRERDRVKVLQDAPPPLDPPRPRKEIDEIANERGIELLAERGETPGSRLPIHLHSSTRAPTLQHVAERMNLICAQNNLQPPARSVPSLMTLACEVCHCLHSLCIHLCSRLLGKTKATYNPCPHVDILIFRDILYISFYIFDVVFRISSSA